jgi:hypothetical protein
VSDDPSPYRREGDTWCLDLRVREVRQLFDLRDPAPFRERDLDPGVVDYLLEATEEIPRRAPIKVVVFVSDEREPSVSDDAVRASIRNYFEHALAVEGMRIRAHLRQGRMAVIVGVTVLVACLLIANAISPSVTWKRILREGLVIGGWVAIWRPVEHFLYDWWPFLERRRVLRRILDATVEIDWGKRMTRAMPATNAAG